MNRHLTQATIITLLFFMSACSEGPEQLSTGPEPDIAVRSIATGECEHNFIRAKSDPAAEILVASDGTYYECITNQVHAAAGGELVHPDHWIENIDSQPYTVRLNGGYIYDMGGSTNVYIEDPVNVKVLNEAGEWLDITGNTHIIADQISIGEGGSAIVITNGVVIPQSGGDENG